jgi:hypothetical protein
MPMRHGWTSDQHRRCGLAFLVVLLRVLVAVVRENRLPMMRRSQMMKHDSFWLEGKERSSGSEDGRVEVPCAVCRCEACIFPASLAVEVWPAGIAVPSAAEVWPAEIAVPLE